MLKAMFRPLRLQEEGGGGGSQVPRRRVGCHAVQPMRNAMSLYGSRSGLRGVGGGGGGVEVQVKAPFR